MAGDSRFALDGRFDEPELSGSEAQSKELHSDFGRDKSNQGDENQHSEGHGSSISDDDQEQDDEDGTESAMDSDGFAGPSNEGKLKPLTPEALAAARATQERAGIVYISRIPPGMRPTKVRHLMSQYGEIGRVYLQQEGVSMVSSSGYFRSAE